MIKELSTDLKSRIADHHAKAQAAAEKAITHGLEAGKLLLQAKDDCDHGGWLPFLKSLNLNSRTAQRYMRLAKNEDALKSDSVSHLNMTQSLELLSSKHPDSVNIEGGPSLFDFGISGLSEDVQLSAIPEDGSLVFITPSSKHPGFYFVEKFDEANSQMVGWKRPIREDAVVCCLDVLGLTRELWSMDKNTTDEPLFMNMNFEDSAGYHTVKEMGIIPADG